MPQPKMSKDLWSVNMFWMGRTIGRMEKLSMTSFLRAGHNVRLFSYEEVEGIPKGVEMADASQLAPENKIISLRHKESGSYALASDYFRYLVFKENLGYWSDTDVVCLEPVTLQSTHVIGWEDEIHANGAFLYLDARSPILDDAIGLFRDNFVPPWVRFKKAWPYKLRNALNIPFSPSDLPWGVFGPAALTALIKKHGLTAQVLPRDVFYPVSIKQARSLLDPNFSLNDYLTSKSLVVHLWNERLKRLDKDNPPVGSPLFDLYHRFGV
jgi:hypothetical protein